jgi:hypothetical protein
MKLTPNQRVVLAVLAGTDGGLYVAEIAARSGRRYVPGVIRVLESLRGDGLVSPLDIEAARRWRITEAGRSALTRYSRAGPSAQDPARAAPPGRELLPASQSGCTTAR